MTHLRRRAFLAAATSLLATPMLADSARAIEWKSGSDGRGERTEPLGSGRLSSMTFRGEGNRQFKLTNLLVLADGGAWYADFQRRVVRRDEDKIGILADIPLVGSLFTPRLRGKNFDHSLQLGLVFQLNDTLLIDLHRSKLAREQLAEKLIASKERSPTLTLPGASGPVQSVGAANQKISYFLIGGPDAVAPGQAPKPLVALAEGAQATGIGSAYNNGQTLLTLVRPSILTGWS